MLQIKAEKMTASVYLEPWLQYNMIVGAPRLSHEGKSAGE